MPFFQYEKDERELLFVFPRFFARHTHTHQFLRLCDCAAQKEWVYKRKRAKRWVKEITLDVFFHVCTQFYMCVCIAFQYSALRSSRSSQKAFFSFFPFLFICWFALCSFLFYVYIYIAFCCSPHTFYFHFPFSYFILLTFKNSVRALHACDLLCCIYASWRALCGGRTEREREKSSKFLWNRRFTLQWSNTFPTWIAWCTIYYIYK